MKHGRTRQRHHNGQTKTPSAIHFPPEQLPPIFKPRKEPEALRAFALPKSPEALVEAPPPKKPKRKAPRKTAKPQGKPATRKAAPRTRKAATSKRKPKAATLPPDTKSTQAQTPAPALDQPPAPAPAIAAPKKQEPSLAKANQPPPLSYAVTYNNAASPLPRNRSLAIPRRNALATVGKWLRKMVMKRRPVSAQVSNAHAISEISALRDEVIRLQGTLDQLLERSKSPPR